MPKSLSSISGSSFLKLLVTCLLFTLSHFSHAADYKADSTFKAILRQPNDTNKVLALLQFGEPFELTDSAFASTIYNQAVAIGRKVKSGKFESKALVYKGILLKTYGNMDEALLAYQEAYRVAKRAGSILQTGKALVNIGNVLAIQIRLEEAMKANLEACKYLEMAGDQKALSLTLANISNLFYEQKLYEKSIEYGHKAIEAAQKSGNPGALGSAYMATATSFYKLGNHKMYLDYNLKSRDLFKQSGQNIKLRDVFQNLASFYVELDTNYAKAALFADSCVQLSRFLPGENLPNALVIRAAIATEQNQLKRSQQLLDEARILITNSTSMVLKQDFENQMYRLEKAKGNYKQAMNHLILHRLAMDSILKIETMQSNITMEARYQSKLKETKISKLETEKENQQLSIRQRNFWMFGLSLGLVLVLAIGFLYFKNAKRKALIATQTAEIQQQKIKELEQERQLVATNSILKGQDEERSRLARDLHDGLGGMLSGLKFSMNTMKGNMILDQENAVAFEKSIGQLDSVITEMRRVAHSMMPEALVRFGLKEASQDLCDQFAKSTGLTIHFQAMGVDSELDKSVSLALYRIEQELLNNIIKHAEATEIQVQLVKDENQIGLTVEDNGKGFNVQQVKQGAGLSSIQTRVEALGGRLDIQSKPGEGSSFLVEISTS